ncbi:MAG: putative bifunctional diguanylate cyclase/phosphodiesterase [Terriglobales bacterium]
MLAQAGRQLGKVAERDWCQRRLEYDASHDALTGLPNRSLFLDRLGRVLARARRGNSRFAVLLLDLDRFHVVNDSLGHVAGDELLRLISERLSGALRSSDMIARWPKELARLGGDVFTVLLEDLPHDSDALRVAERLQASLAPPLTLGGRQFFITASIGIASGATEGDAGRLLHESDLAMGRAKTLGGARAEIYDQALQAAAVERMHLETDLRQALTREQFVLHYQPIVALDSGAIQGVEALVRWRRNGKELVYPGEFIPTAEDTGLILPLGLWVLREACVAARLWQREFASQRRLAIGVNLSARQFAQPDLAAQVERILKETGIEPATVRLEITESALLGGTEAGGNDAAEAVFAQLKSLGLQIGLDDFGTGYSSFSYLQRFPLDIVKIDRSFVAQLGSERNSEAIVRSILDLARNLNLRAVAEGAETAEQVERLRALGCPLAQGFYFARPMDAAHLRNYLTHAA